MNFPKGVGKFLGWLGGARMRAPQPVPTAPAFTTYDPGESIIVDFFEGATEKESQEFLYFGVHVHTPQSSNVAEIWYDVEQTKLFVTFKNTYTYEYFDIPVELAYDFFIAVSKGRWVWDNLRTTRRAYQFLTSLNGRVPVRMEDPAAGSVKAALGSLSILGRDPFSHTKSAKRVKIKYQQVNRLLAQTPKFSRNVNRSFQFLSKKRQRVGLSQIRKIIRGL